MTPDQNEIFEFFLRSDNIRGNNVTPQLSAPATLTPTVISDTEIDLTWTGVTNATNYILERAEQSDYSDAIEIYSGSLASFNDTGLSGGTTYYYRVKAHAANFLDSDWTNASATTDVAFTTSDLTFTTNSGDLINTAQVFTATGGFAFGHTGLDTLFLAAGQNGRIYYQVADLNNINAFLGFKTTNAQGGFATFYLGLQIDGSLHFEILQTGLGLIDSGYVVVPPLWFGIFRCGASFKPQVSADGITWVDLHIYRGFYNLFNSAAMYVVCDLFTTAVMSFPKIDIYDAGNVSKLFINNGNSIAGGSLPGGALSTANIGQQCWYAIDGASDWHYNNNALLGQSIAAAITAFPTNTQPLLVDGFSKIIVSYLEGTNQLTTSTPAQAFVLLRTYIELILDERPEAHVMVYMTPSGSPDFGMTNANRVAFNVFITTLPGLYSRVKIVDITGTPELNDATAYLNATYYWDGTHLTQAGYDLLAGLGIPVALTF